MRLVGLTVFVVCHSWYEEVVASTALRLQAGLTEGTMFRADALGRHRYKSCDRLNFVRWEFAVPTA